MKTRFLQLFKLQFREALNHVLNTKCTHMPILIHQKFTCTLKGDRGLSTLVFEQGDQADTALSIAALQLRRAGPALHWEPGQLSPDPSPFLTYNFAILCQQSPFIKVLCGSKYKQIFSTCPSPVLIGKSLSFTARGSEAHTFFTCQQCGARLIYTLSNGCDSGVYHQQLLIT